jgi:hypothetical protein
MASPIALVHMNIVNAIARKEAKIVIFFMRLWSPFAAESIYQCALCIHGLLNMKIKDVIQIIIGATCEIRDNSHISYVEKIAPDKI